MRGGSLRLRLLAAGAVSVAVALALSAFGLIILFERHVERRLVAELSTQLEQVVAGVDRNSSGALTMVRPPADPRFARPLSGLYWQIATSGAMLRSRSLWDAELVLPEDALSDRGLHVHSITGPSEDSLLVVERKIALPSRLGGGAARVAVAIDTAELLAATRSFGADLAPYLALIALFLIVAAWAQVAVGLRPLAAVKERLAAIRTGRARRLGDEFPDEVTPLAREVDGLLDSRDAQIERARARAADLAHGLKTPLQVLAGDVTRLREAGQYTIADDIEHVAGAMRRHVDRELTRARVAGGSVDARAEIGPIVEGVVAVLKRTPVGAALAWDTDVPSGLTARIDGDDLAEAVGNLAENAVRHARGTVSISARSEAGAVIIAILDDGPGIVEEQIDQVLARGVRGDVSTGAGLGLSIAREIVETWGGTLQLCNEQRGFKAVLQLAACPAH